jgi:putative SOS response-associated peptidase YedK
MCGRFVLQNVEILGERFRIGVIEDFAADPVFAARFNIAPSQPIVSVVVQDGGTRALRQMRWGFAPPWFKVTPKQPPPINARAETLFERPMFRGAVAGRRCLIPADGFYEWQTIPGQRTKQPIHFRLKDGRVFAFAGLYTESSNPSTGETVQSCAIVTTAANELMAPFHHRMPVILTMEDESTWLDRSADQGAVLACLRQYAAEEMEAYPVSPLVSSARNDGAALILPLF